MCDAAEKIQSFMAGYNSCSKLFKVNLGCDGEWEEGTTVGIFNDFDTALEVVKKYLKKDYGEFDWDILRIYDKEENFYGSGTKRITHYYLYPRCKNKCGDQEYYFYKGGTIEEFELNREDEI